MQSLGKVVLLSLLWASALIASAYFLKGLAIGDWVDSLLYLAAGAFVSPYVLHTGHTLRCTSRRRTESPSRF